VFWDFDLPSISSRLDLELLRKIIIDRGINLAMIDPLFLCLIAGSATPIQTSNVFQMGPLLRELSYIGQETGCTMGICHHTTKRLERPGEAPTLEDLSMAGIAEWARQWCLGGRRTRYEEGSGRHDLWLRVGGSAGHSGLYAVDVDEGVLAEDFSGRKWDVTVTSAKDAKLQLDQQKEAVKTQREQEKLSTDMLAVMTVLDALSDGRGETVRELRKVTGNSQARAQAAVDQLLDQGVLEECEVKKANRKKPHPAVRKKPKEDGSDGN
jgi:hypothetical protein